MKQESFACDVCGKTRDAANHWLIAVTFDKGDTSLRFGHEAIDAGHILIVKWSDELAKDGSASHICGADCSHKYLSQWMTAQQKETA